MVDIAADAGMLATVLQTMHLVQVWSHMQALSYLATDGDPRPVVEGQYDDNPGHE